MKAILAVALLLLAGCSQPPATESSADPPVETRPVESPPATVTGLEFVAQLMDGSDPLPSGSGIWVHDGIAYGSALGAGFFIADVSNPAAPQLLYRAPEGSETEFSRDADLVHAEGRKTLVLATQNDGLHVYDVSNPRAPVFAARTLTADTSGEAVSNHNIAVVPGTSYVFNSRSGGAGSTNDIIDVRDPYAPRIVGTYGTHGCHDIVFHGQLGDEGFRGYCAGIQRSEIWDMSGFDGSATDFGIALISTIEGTDSPVVGSPAFARYPFRTLHHLAIVDDDASVLIVGDEHNGGGSPGTCFAYDENLGVSTPFGALWFYDISDESAPELMGWFSPPTVEPRPTSGDTGTPSCTAHFGTVVPGEQKVVMAWYHAGVVLIDFTDPASPVLVDQYIPDGINTWDARIDGTHVYTGDIARGMDVLRLV